MSRNVLLLTVDSLRADHCGFLDGGGALNLTPAIDDLAEDSLVFERTFAPGPRTPSSMPAVFTGEFFRPTDLGVYEGWETKSRRWQARRRRIGTHMARFRSIAERMHERGYDTGAVTANPWTTRDTNFHRGFDEFHAVTGPDAAGRSWYSPLAERLEDVLGTDWDNALLTWPDFYDTVRRTGAALSEPYFLWVFLLDPHQPYVTPREYRVENTGPEMLYANARYNYAHQYTEELPPHLDRRLRRAYRDTVRSVDGFVDRVRRDFSADDPVTVFHADHGEAFGEHGTIGHRPQLYRENVHVPLFVHGVGETGRVDAPVSLRSLPGVVGAAADGTVSPDRFVRPYVLSRTEEGERVGVRGTEWSYQTAADGWEYVHGAEREELYRIATDPDERENVAGARPEVASLLGRVVADDDEHQRERGRITDGVEGLEAVKAGASAGRDVANRP